MKTKTTKTKRPLYPMTKREALALLDDIDCRHCSNHEATDLAWLRDIIQSIYNKWWDDALRRVTKHNLPPRESSSVERNEYWEQRKWRWLSS